MRILIVEDDMVSALILKRTLEEMGYEVTTTSNGVEAWNFLQEETVRLVISDWMMPKMDGLDLCRHIRGRQGYPYIYLILLTAKSERAERLEGFRAGVDDFMTKPLDRGELVARLEVARRIFAMQEALENHSARLAKLNADQKQQNEQLEKTMDYLTVANRRFAELFEGLPVACYAYDAEGQVQEWNRAAVELFGFQLHEVLCKPLWEIFREKNAQKQAHNIQQHKALIQKVFAGESLVGTEFEVQHRDGRRLHILVNTFPLSMMEDQITGALSATIDITARKALEKQVADQLHLTTEMNRMLRQQQKELARANTRLAELVTTDGLTGLKNHRHFRESLETSFAAATEKNTLLSVVMLDIDRFKMYNDTYGHPAGDDVLRAIANTLRRNVPRHHMVARYGGEEFILLLPKTDVQGSQEIAERLRAAIEAYPWSLRPVVASFGIATVTPLTLKAAMLIEEADQALYHSKARGGNCVTHYQDLDLEDAGPLRLAS